MQTQKKKIKIVCIMGKSGAGKSTIINDLVKLFPETFYAVKSLTTRQPRENDPEDLKTHVFSDFGKFNVDKITNNLICLYESDKGYYSWTNEESFEENKINLYAIDPKACVEMIDKFKKKYEILPIYVYAYDYERLKRLKVRDSVDELPEEKHLSHEILSNKQIYFDFLLSTKDRFKNTMKLIDYISGWLWH